MKLAIVFPVLNQLPLARAAVDFAEAYQETKPEIIVLDNASDPAFTLETTYPRDVKVWRFDQNHGVYPMFWKALECLDINKIDADVVAFLHSDLMLCEQGYDKRILQAFEDNPKLGLVGFVGSDEIDQAGGRGAGTTSNFQGMQHQHQSAHGNLSVWNGSGAQAHGKRNDGLTKAAVVDGCAMVFRRSVLEQIKQRPEFPPHHFYDRLLSCETRELGYEVAVLGIACDHISGQTVNAEDAYALMAKDWALKNIKDWAGVTNAQGVSWDTVIYQEAERQWLAEYRDKKHFIPCKV